MTLFCVYEFHILLVSDERNNCTLSIQCSTKYNFNFFPEDFPFSTFEQMKSLLKWLFSSMNPWFFGYLAIKIHQNFSGSSKRTFLHWPFQFKLFIDISSVHKQWRLCVFSFFQSTTCQYWLCIFKIKTSYLWTVDFIMLENWRWIYREREWLYI